MDLSLYIIISLSRNITHYRLINQSALIVCTIIYNNCDIRQINQKDTFKNLAMIMTKKQDFPNLGIKFTCHVYF